MKAIFYALLALSMGSLWFLNIFAGIIGGIWLILSGGLGLVIAGVIISFIMPFAYSIAFLPTMLLLPLLTKALEKGNKFWAGILAFILAGYNNFITIIWVLLVFQWFIYSTGYPIIALWLFGYSVVMGPLGYMASKEGPDAGAGTTFGVLFAQVAYFILSINIFFGGSLQAGYTWLWIMLLGYSAFATWLGTQAVPKQTKAIEMPPTDFVDPLINTALDIMAKYEMVSASLFQRRLGIGFERAWEIQRSLAKYGLITLGGEEEPSKVLVTNPVEVENMKQIFNSFPKYDIARFGDTEIVEMKETTDELYPGVKAYAKTQKTMSAAKVQKQFGTGYSRAAVLLDKLVEEGVLANPKNHQYKVLA